MANTRCFEGLDENKDQTYFLNQLQQDQLEKVMFPIGDLDKKEVVKLQKKQVLRQQRKKILQEFVLLVNVTLKHF